MYLPELALLKGFPGETVLGNSDYRIITLHLGEELLVEFVSHIVSETAELEIKGRYCHETGSIPSCSDRDFHVWN